MDNYKMQMKLEGDDKIDLKTLKAIIDCIDTCFSTITEKIKRDEKPVIKTIIRPGCVEIDLFWQFVIAAGAATTGNVAMWGIQSFVKWLRLRKHLGDKPPKEIVRENNDVKFVNNGNMNFF